MNRASKLFIVIVFTAGFAAAQAPGYRTFTNAQGKAIQARFVTLSGDQVTIEMAGGQTFTLAVSQFSAADQDYIKETAARPASSGKLFSAPNDKLPPEAVNEVVGQPLFMEAAIWDASADEVAARLGLQVEDPAGLLHHREVERVLASRDLLASRHHGDRRLDRADGLLLGVAVEAPMHLGVLEDLLPRALAEADGGVAHLELVLAHRDRLRDRRSVAVEAARDLSGSRAREDRGDGGDENRLHGMRFRWGFEGGGSLRSAVRRRWQKVAMAARSAMPGLGPLRGPGASP
jgi:hypothetical protein